MNNTKKEIRDFVFRGLLLESEAEVYRKAGINVGVDIGQTEEQLLGEALAPFSVSRRNQALEMARLYAVLHAFENEIRSLIKDTLEEKVGLNWWDTQAIPHKIKQFAESRKNTAEKDSWLEGAKGDPLEYVDFGHLASIMVANWDHFKDIVPGQDWITQRMNELEKRGMLWHTIECCSHLNFREFICIFPIGIRLSVSDLDCFAECTYNVGKV